MLMVQYDIHNLKNKIVNFQLSFPATVTITIQYYDTLNHSTCPKIAIFSVYHMPRYLVYQLRYHHLGTASLNFLLSLILTSNTGTISIIIPKDLKVREGRRAADLP